MPENVPFPEYLERVVLEELHAAAPPPVRERIGLHLERFGSALASVASHEPSILWNRVIGLRMGAPAESDTPPRPAATRC